MRVVIVIVLLAGTAAASPCPHGKALARLAKTLYPVEIRTHGDGTIEPIDRSKLRCRRGLVTLELDDGLLVALASGTWEEGEVTDDSLRTVIEAAIAVDLDGDGVDELVLQKRHDGHEQSGGTMLEILDDTGAFVAELDIGSRNGTMPIGEGGWDCDSTWDLIRGRHRTRRIVTVGGCRGAQPDGFAVGRHVYALEGGALVAQASLNH